MDPSSLRTSLTPTPLVDLDDITAPSPSFVHNTALLTELADATMNTDVQGIPWVADALSVSASLASEMNTPISQGDITAPSSRLTTQELQALDDDFIRHYSRPLEEDDELLDATSMAIDEALDAAQEAELAGLAVTRDFDVARASTVFAHLDESIFEDLPMANAFNVVTRPLQFVNHTGPAVTPNFAALYPIHMLAAILNFFPLPSNVPGAWATITLLVHQLIGHLQLRVDGLTAILKCPICLQVLQRPYVLDCGHNVCEHCLHTYLLTTLNKHITLYPGYDTQHRALILHIFFFYNSVMTSDDRRTLRARILASLTRMVRPTYECPICRTLISRPPIFVYTLADVIDIALLLGVPTPDDVYIPINHNEWRDFFIVVG